MRPRRIAAVLRAFVVVSLLAVSRGPQAAAAADLHVLGAPPLVVHAPADRVRVGTDLAARGPAEMARIARALGLPAPARIDCYLLPRQGSDQPESWGLPRGPGWASGLALDDRPVIILRTAEDRGSSGNEVATTLSHELVHAIMAAALGPRHRQMPAWWREGLAAYLSHEWRLLESVHVVGLALSGRFVPLAGIAHEFPAEGPRVQWAYLESFAFLNWLTERSGPEALPAFFARYVAGETFHQAFTAAFGASPQALERDWKGEFLWRYRWMPVLTSSSTLWFVMVMLFVVVGLGKRRRAARLLAAWEIEEAQRAPVLSVTGDGGADGDADEEVEADDSQSSDDDDDPPVRGVGIPPG